MKNHHRALRIFLTFVVLLIAGNAGAQPLSMLNGVYAGSTSTPITLKVGVICPETPGLFFDTAFWDFGPGATPSNAITPTTDPMEISFSQGVAYSTPGDKIFTVTYGASAPDTFELHIYDCSVPAIPNDAIVIKSDTTVARSSQGPSMAYWVNPGVTLKLNNAMSDTIFAEAGSTITGVYESILYMKHGSVLHTPGGYMNSVIFGNGASIYAGSSDFTLNCPTLDFDYSNAPPNAAHASSSVKDDLNSVSLTVSPNPTSGMLSVQGLPSANITISVFNTLGETVIVQKLPTAPDFTLDLTKLVPGTYYIRISSANSVVTKMVVRE